MTDDATTLAEPVVLEGPLATRARWRPEACPISGALGIVGSRSAMLIMREALYGTTRFDDFVARVGVTDAVAAARLRELTGAGLLQRVPYREPGARTRYEYRLTEAGSDFAPVLMALYEWGAKHVSAAPLHFHHRGGCGAAVRAELVCDEGHRVTPPDIGVTA